MELYLNSTGIISGAGNNSDANFLTALPDNSTGKFLCKEPDYSGYIQPMQLRRMSKVVRIGIGASKICMQNAGIEKPDAISIGTAMGCLHDTEFFLTKMVDQDEQMLTPTAFIQSTHNTVSGQIALLVGCYGHNLTFVQRGHSFEHALINTQLYLDEHSDEKMLVGGIDELTDNSYTAFKLGGVYNEENIAGEGATFFVATTSPMQSRSLCVKDIHCFTGNDVEKELQSFSNRNNIQAVDIVITSNNATSAAFPGAEQITYKNLCGDYPVASSFAVGALLHAVQTCSWPQAWQVSRNIIEVKRVVLISNFKHYYACWLMDII